MAAPVKTPSSPPMVCDCEWQRKKERSSFRTVTPPMDIRPVAVATPGNPLHSSLRGRVIYPSNALSCRVIPGHRNG